MTKSQIERMKKAAEWEVEVLKKGQKVFVKKISTLMYVKEVLFEGVMGVERAYVLHDNNTRKRMGVFNLGDLIVAYRDTHPEAYL